jgi:hypothetical protein
MKSSGVLFAFLATLSLLLTSATTEKGYQKILGTWEFSAPAARQPYDSGVLSLKEVDQKLKGEFTVQGQSLAIPKIEFEGETLSLEFEVENTPITLKLKLKDGLFEGKTDTPDGPVIVKAKPATKK